MDQFIKLLRVLIFTGLVYIKLKIVIFLTIGQFAKCIQHLCLLIYQNIHFFLKLLAIISKY